MLYLRCCTLKHCTNNGYFPCQLTVNDIAAGGAAEVQILGENALDSAADLFNSLGSKILDVYLKDPLFGIGTLPLKLRKLFGKLLCIGILKLDLFHKKTPL